jgi:hypothetical protein
MGMGARGGITSLGKIAGLIRNGRRRPEAFTPQQLEAARMAR